MKPITFARGSALLMVFAILTPGIRAQSAPAPPIPVAAPSSGENVEELKSLLADVFAALKSGDTQKVSTFYASMVLPNHAEWFAKAFGPSEGALLESKYASLQSATNDWIGKQFLLALNAGKTEPQVTPFQKPISPEQRVLHDVGEAMVEPFTIYSVRTHGALPENPSTFYIGDFVYVDGGFRYMDGRVWLALSTAPPPSMRIRVGGTVQRAKIVNQVDPVYPESARRNRIAGTVVLHAIIGTDGTVRSLSVENGPPELQQAAIDAVRQWQYQPTTLGGNPVEIDTLINVMFQLR